MIEAPESGFRGPVKRSVTIAGHQTSISLEPIFWAALERAAVRLELPLSAMRSWVLDSLSHREREGARSAEG
jgi:predicted DNA-binding ribbon-helix-helix protein